MTYSDDTLIAYLNRDLPNTDLAAIDAALMIDPALAARIRDLDPLSAHVASAFSEVPSQARLDDVGAVFQSDTTNPGPPWLRYAAVMMIGVGLGIGAMLIGKTPQTDDWKMQVAQYQSLYTPQTVAAINFDRDKLDAQFARVSKAIGADLTASDFEGLDGLTLRRAQILGMDDVALVQIVFRSDDGTPVALCLVTSDETRDPISNAMRGLASQSWADGAHEYLLIGGNDPTALNYWAAQIIPRV